MFIVAAVDDHGLPYERWDFASQCEAEAHAEELRVEGYTDIKVSEQYASLDEMYADLEEE